MSRHVYTPVQHGFVQNSYADQMDSAYVGQVANASDYNLTDSYVTGEVGPNGLIAGVGAVNKVIPNAIRPGVNENALEYPKEGATVDDFEAITVRNDQMGTNAAGMPCMFEGEMINGLRRSRVGGRTWVMLSKGTSTSRNIAHWIVSDATSHGHHIGSFSAVAIPGDTVELPFMKFCGMFTAPVGGFVAAKVEIITA